MNIVDFIEYKKQVEGTHSEKEIKAVIRTLNAELLLLNHALAMERVKLECMKEGIDK